MRQYSRIPPSERSKNGGSPGNRPSPVLSSFPRFAFSSRLCFFAVLSRKIAHFRQNFWYKRNMPFFFIILPPIILSSSLRLRFFASLRKNSFWLQLCRAV